MSKEITDKSNKVVDLEETEEKSVTNIENINIELFDPRFEDKYIFQMDWIGVLSYAFSSASFPLIDFCKFINNTNQCLEDVKINFNFQFNYIENHELVMDKIEPGSHFEFKPKLKILAKELFDLNEGINECLEVEILEGKNRIFIESYDFPILPMNQWSGTDIFPESLASFVMPNIPEINALQGRAAQLLKEKTGESSFTGYLTGDKNVARQQMAAMYATLYEQNINYSVLPASFGEPGQKIRLAKDVLKYKIGNCIEMSLVFAAMCESIGLNPFIVVTKNHAFAGLWLKESYFEDNVVYDISELRKRLSDGINDVEVIECTAVNQGKQIPFETAVKTAREIIEDGEDFKLLIDIKRSHYSGIRPMPIKVVEAGDIKIVDYGLAEDAISLADATKEIEERFLDTTKKDVVNKRSIWMKNLLDLTKRNPLISFRLSKSTVQIFNSNLGDLEDALSKGEAFEIFEVISDWTGSSSRVNFADVQSNTEFISKISKAEFKSRRLRTFLKKQDLESTLKILYRGAKNSLEENGANTLYLAMGFLEWIDPTDPKDLDGNINTRLAPIVLLPVDLIRRARGTYQLVLRDEDAQLNITLLEMLRQKFDLHIGGLDPLPLDDFGVDLELVFNSIRKAIMGQQGWDVTEVACLGLFSFSQFVMWNDLKTRFDLLTENKVVKGLVNGRFTDYTDEITPEMIDDSMPVSDLAIPLSIDSSQLAAVIEASKGGSFVLHGPPGTGKSQTIANLIANTLYQGKSVLFVAEKMVALNVVQERLESIGLGDYCLEIHSNKTNKKVVLEKLEKNLSLSKQEDSNEFKTKSEWIENIKGKLNEDLFELHKERKQGTSLYDAIGKYTEFSKVNRPYKLSDETLSNLDVSKFSYWEQAIRKVSRAVSVLTHPYDKHPLKNFQKDGYTTLNKNRIEDLIHQIINDLTTLQNTINKVEIKDIEDVELFFNSKNIACLISIDKIIQLRNLKTILGKEEFNTLHDPDTIEKMKEIVEKKNQYDDLKSDLEKKYTEEFENFDWVKTRKDFLDASNVLFFKNIKINKSLNELNAISKQNKVDPNSALEELGEIATYQEEKNKLTDLLINIIELLGINLNVDANDIDQLEDLYELSKIIVEMKAQSNLTLDELFSIYNNLIEIYGSKNIRIEDLFSLYNGINEKLTEIENLAGVNIERFLNTEYWIESVKEHLVLWQENIDLWKDWSNFYASLKELKDVGLQEVFDRLLAIDNAPTSENNNNNNYSQAERFVNEFYASFYYDLIAFYLKESSSLSRFNGYEVEGRIEEYNKLVDEYEKLSKEQVKIKLSQQLPDKRVCDDAEAKQIATLTRVIHSKGRGVSVRQLFQDTNLIIKKLTPCLLMSPISVAQYIDPTFPKFDLVIFDEASQIRTSVAVGAMSRAENCIIVGDPKQMPPTDFFNSKKMDEDNLNIEDLESLLDDCLAINMPQRYLDWHYRSQSESLISFSNYMYYGNSMKTVPSPYDRLSKVRFVKIDGVYSRGTTRINKDEAETIVREVVKRLRDPEKRKDSIGVVTFNSMQQMYIDDLLQEELRKDPSLDNIYQELKEPIFIKNLENVQGDERDVIFFSICYGPDIEGKITMNFGPLNKKGGWRRLNVAVSRSRKEMHIYSSLEPEDIIIRGATSDGVIGIRNFLEFAKYGRMYELKSNKTKEIKSEKLIDDIARSIEARGYKVDKNIGSSEFTLDIAVIDPRNEGRYLCVIIIDGIQYLSAKTARDRYRLMPTILNYRGWELYRIWTIDWYDNKKIEENRLLQFIDDLATKKIEEISIQDRNVINKEISDTNKQEEIDNTKNDSVKLNESKGILNHNQAEEMEVIELEGDNNSHYELTSSEINMVVNSVKNISSEIEVIDYNAQILEKNFNEAISDNSNFMRKHSNSSKIVKQPKKKYYETTKFTNSYVSHSLEENKDTVTKMMQEIIDKESPIMQELILKRLFESFPGKTLSSGNITLLKKLIKSCEFNTTRQSGKTVYWRVDQNPNDYTDYRIPIEDNVRIIDYLCDYEIANFIWAVILENFDNEQMVSTLDEEEVSKEVLRGLGYIRTTERMINIVKPAFSNAIKRKYIVRKGKYFTIGEING